MSRKIAFGVSVAAAVCSGAVLALGAGRVVVVQRGRAFDAAAMQVSRGDTVAFVNQDGFLHQVFVDAPGMRFDSDEQAPGEVVSVRFDARGVFDVMCHIHPKMLLRVEVR